MWFRILGPVRAYRDGVELELGSPQQRSVFAVLAAGADAPVGGPAIAQLLWGDAPPPTAAATIQQYVYRLRRLVEPQRAAYARAATIRRVSGGYQLVTGDDHLDVAQWRELVAAARTAVDRGDRTGAADAYEKALRLWSGPVAADLPQRVRAHPVFAGLERERVVAIAEATDLALADGRTAGLVARLEQAVESHRFDEALHARLIRALSAVGRPADAAQCFETIRERLATELGIEPGPALREAGLGVRAEPPRPAQLPADLPTFSGRAAELDRLDALATGELPLAVVSGMGGAGKTSLVVHWAHRAAGRFPDGQLFVDLRGYAPRNAPVEPRTALHGFLEALGVPRENHPVSVGELSALYRSRLADRRVLVVLDNARDDDQVLPLLPAGAGCAAVVTSRSHLGSLVVGQGAGSVVLEAFDDAEAGRFLRSRLGARVDAEPQAVADIIAACGGLPLALAVCAAWAQRGPAFTLPTVAAELHRRDGLDAFADVASDRDLRAVFSWSYRQLSTAAAEVFRRFGAQPGADAPTALVASIAGRDHAETRRLLAELVDTQLLTEVKPGRYRMHDLIRRYATELSDEAERELTVRRALDHQLHSLVACARAAFPHQNPVDPGTPLPGVAPGPVAGPAPARAWFAEEYENLPAALDAAESRGLDRYLWLFAWSLHSLLGEQMGRWDQAAAIGRRGLAAAERQGESWWRSYLHNNLAGCYAELADYVEAFRQVESSVRVSRELGDPVRTATGLIGMAALLVDYGPWPAGEQIERAAAFADEALTIAETFDPAAFPDRREADEKRLRQIRAAAHEYAAYRLLHRTGDLAAAVAEVGRAIALARSEGMNREPQLLDTVARFQQQAGADAEAIRTRERAIAMQPGDVWPTAQRMAAMAAGQARLGNRAAVAELRDRLRQLLHGVHHPAARRMLAELDDQPTAE